MKTIDTRGELCPTPLIMTKKAISGAALGEQFEILSDNDTARCNLMSYLEELGIVATCSQQQDIFRITFATGSTAPMAANSSNAEQFCAAPVAAKDTKGYAVVLSSNVMGRGDDALGEILMRACINSLGELDQLPSVIILYNSGVQLAISGSDTAASLLALHKRSVEIIVCGTCVDFYGLKDKIAVGTISNMYKINTVLSEATKVVYP